MEKGLGALEMASGATAPNGVSAHFEPICSHAGIVRVYEAGGSYEARSPYCAALTVKVLADGAAELSGLSTGLMRPSFWKAVLSAVHGAGYGCVVWQRFTAGGGAAGRWCEHHG